MLNSAIAETSYERGWFGMGGFPDSGFSPLKKEDKNDDNENTSSMFTNKPPKGVTNEPPKIRRVINLNQSKK